ncbi:glycosyltransferase [Devosia sp. D6-9]|nr:glycosyltransferase [Devosia sp. D6-9]
MSADAAQPLVSVILPTYNRAATLPAAIASVLGQSYANLELIVVDDASPQDIRALVDAIGDPRLRYVRRHANGGAGAARNTGLEHVRGELIAFQDSDDLWLPGKLERQVRTIMALPPAIGVVTAPKILYGRDAAFSFGPGKVTIAPDPAGRLEPGEDQVRHLLRQNRISLQNTLFRRASCPPAPWFDPLAPANEDWEFAIRLARQTRIHEDIEPVALGFISPDSISRNTRKECRGVLRIVSRNKDILGSEPALRAHFLLHLARQMRAIGRPKLARRMIIESVRIYPPSVLELIAVMGRRLTRLLRRQPKAAPAYSAASAPASTLRDSLAQTGR